MKERHIRTRGVVPLAMLGLIALFLTMGGYSYYSYSTQERAGVSEAPFAPRAPIPVLPSVRETARQEPFAKQRALDASAPGARPEKVPQRTEHREESAAKSGATSGGQADRLNEWFDEQPSKNAAYGAEERPGWEILSEAERAELPACADTLMTVPPVPLDAITGIEPIGSANPPEHTLASISSDTYIAVRGQGTMTPLVAPGDMWIMLIKPRYGVTQDPEDHVIKYAFCKDVYGVVDHVKSFSPEMKRLVDDYVCPNPSDTPGDDRCPILLLEKVAAGTPLGTVGRMQGNFNFGTWDLRVTHAFISPWRHGFLTKHSTCPFDYFPSPLKEQLVAKIESAAGGSCGSVEHDVPGTLRGDWFLGDASPTRPADWGKLLHFGPNNRLSGQSVISASGIFVAQPTKWIFTALDSGNVNRRFSDVVPGAIYCYDNDGRHQNWSYEKGVRSGRILVQLTSPTELDIEHQEGMCAGSGGWAFTTSTHYER